MLYSINRSMAYVLHMIVGWHFHINPYVSVLLLMDVGLIPYVFMDESPAALIPFLLFIQLFSVYIFMFELVIGIVINSFVNECKEVRATGWHGKCFPKAVQLHQKFLSLQDNCMTGIFTVVTGCTLLAIIELYLLIIILVFPCLSYYKTSIVWLVLGSKVMTYLTNLFYLANILDDCFEHFKKISIPLR